ncbi:hypothetical protein GCK32_020641 [Trichostrongylus colubriformis]|uniref:Uncharacterized protein n=1 Tax=Trichostrongylus colubriformis TaxID=6319 RepID=A0AAN8F1H5_TRICO
MYVARGFTCVRDTPAKEKRSHESPKLFVILDFTSCYSDDMFHSVLCEPYSQYLDIRELEKAQTQCIVNYLPHPEKSIHLLNYMFCFLDDHLSTTANSESYKVLWKSAFGHLSFQPVFPAKLVCNSR